MLPYRKPKSSPDEVFGTHSGCSDTFAGGQVMSNDRTLLNETVVNTVDRVITLFWGDGGASMSICPVDRAGLRLHQLHLLHC